MLLTILPKNGAGAGPRRDRPRRGAASWPARPARAVSVVLRWPSAAPTRQQWPSRRRRGRCSAQAGRRSAAINSRRCRTACRCWSCRITSSRRSASGCSFAPAPCRSRPTARRREFRRGAAQPGHRDAVAPSDIAGLDRLGGRRARRRVGQRVVVHQRRRDQGPDRPGSGADVGHRAQNPAFPQQEIDPAEAADAVGAAGRATTIPTTSPTLVFDRLVFGLHPYGRPGQGTPDIDRAALPATTSSRSTGPGSCRTTRCSPSSAT